VDLGNIIDASLNEMFLIMLEEFPRENNTDYDIDKDGQLDKYV
jgi:hypothetical protein